MYLESDESDVPRVLQFIPIKVGEKQRSMALLLQLFSYKISENG